MLSAVPKEALNLVALQAGAGTCVIQTTSVSSAPMLDRSLSDEHRAELLAGGLHLQEAPRSAGEPAVVHQVGPGLLLLPLRLTIWPAAG